MDTWFELFGRGSEPSKEHLIISWSQIENVALSLTFKNEFAKARVLIECRVLEFSKKLGP